MSPDEKEDEKEDKKNKVAAFFAPKRNKIIVGVSAAALIALIIGLSVGLSRCGSGDGGTITSDSSSESKIASDEGSSSSKGNEGSSDSKGNEGSSDSKSEDNTNKITDENFASALTFDGDKFTITLTETDEVTTMVKNGNAVHWTNTAGSGSEEYYSKVSEGGSTTYYIYTKDSSGTWIKDEDDSTSSSYEYYATRDVDEDLFDGKLATSTRTFNEGKGGYTLSYTDDDNVKVDAELYFDNSRIAKAVKTEGGKTKIYTFSDTAVDITLPTNAHTHISSAPGTLDLNSPSVNFKFTCSDCNKTVSRQRRDADTFSSILYGYYPQTHVSDAATIGKLENLTAESNGWYLLEGTYYAKAVRNEYHYDYKFDDGTQIMGATGTYHWFSVDPIEWDVLSSGGGQYSLVSKLLLDMHTYSDAESSDQSPSNNYENSDIRSWLNGEFLTKAFAKDDSYLSMVRVNNSRDTTANTDYNFYACDNTPEKVYLLSYQDYTNAAYFADAKARQCKTSDWARNNHAKCNTEDNYAGTYWTRSPYSLSHNLVSYIDGSNGGEMNDQDASKDYFSVRPAITVKLPAASNHQHTNPTSGSRDWNNGGTTLSGVCPDCGETVTREYASTDTTTGFFYGYYPQTHVSDSTIINALEGKAADETTDWYELDGEYYAKATAANTTELKFDDKTTITKGNEYWYKCEPIEWKVLTSDSATGTYSLLSNLLLDATQYNSATWADDDTAHDHRPCNYSYSSLRTWLNGEFLTKAFFKNSSKPEDTSVDNSAASLQFQNLGLTCNPTTDKVYALSYKNCGTTKWGGYFASADERVGITTDYARASGVAVSADDNSAKYWTRSPTETTTASVVDETGYSSNGDDVTAINCVRPAITIKVS